jgi:DNA-binding MarR family transcriptional regulator
VQKKEFELDPLEQVLTSLRRVIRATDMHSKHLAKISGLTTPQILLLQAIRKLEGAALGQLADEVSLSQPTVTSILDRLEKKEYIERERSTVDKRKVHVHLTERGIEILRDAPTPLQEHFSRQFNDLQEWEQTMMIASLQRVAYMMDAEHIDASPVLDVGTLDRPQEASSKAPGG